MADFVLGILAWPLVIVYDVVEADKNNNLIGYAALAVFPVLMATRVIPVEGGALAYLGIGAAINVFYGSYLVE